jgi:hypothetical protein
MDDEDAGDRGLAASAAANDVDDDDDDYEAMIPI